jgi:hypothetical protein
MFAVNWGINPGKSDLVAGLIKQIVHYSFFSLPEFYDERCIVCGGSWKNSYV